MAALSLLSVLRRLRRSESGAELIEFALTLPLLLLVVLGIIEFGFIFQQYEVVTNAAREGARMASLSTYGSTNAVRLANAQARVIQYLSAGGLDTGPGAVTVCVGPNDATCNGSITQTALPGAGGVGATCVWTVRVKVDYAHPVTFVGGIMRRFGGSWPGTLTLRGRSTMRTEATGGPCP